MEATDKPPVKAVDLLSEHEKQVAIFERLIASPNFEHGNRDKAAQLFVLDLLAGEYPLEEYGDDPVLSALVSEQQVWYALIALKKIGFVKLGPFDEYVYDDEENPEDAIWSELSGGVLI